MPKEGILHNRIPNIINVTHHPLSYTMTIITTMHTLSIHAYAK